MNKIETKNPVEIMNARYMRIGDISIVKKSPFAGTIGKHLMRTGRTYMVILEDGSLYNSADWVFEVVVLPKDTVVSITTN